jgi:ABC-type sugar transport system ATPase subunit
METAIEVTGLRKRFGPTVALEGLSFTVGPGRVTGFVGANGAGKSTAMRIILGLAAERAETLLSASAVPFGAVAAHRATPEEAYLGLTRNAVEFRAATRQQAAP